MAETLRPVAAGEAVVSDAADEVLVAYGLGSCVAVCLYDPVARVGGMVHALLPTSPHSSAEGDPIPDHGQARFVDRGVPLLIEMLAERGADTSRLVANICGGADMLAPPPGALGIGKRNVLAAEAALRSAGLQVRARATGGNAGRTVRFYIADGRVTVRCLGQTERPVDWPDVIESRRIGCLRF